MDPRALSPVLKVLRVCLHLLVAVLLAIAVGHAAAGRVAHPAVVIAVAAAMGAVYAGGAALPMVRGSRVAGVGWLGVLSMVWLVLLGVSPDGVWLAFPLFFLYLHLLPARFGVPAVVVATGASIAAFAWHEGGFAPGIAIGPVLGAAVAVATVLGYQALYRESERRRRLVEDLTATRADLADAERTAGVLAERERLAREIHDTLAQGLSSIQLLLRAAERSLPEDPATAEGHIRRARRSAQDNLAEARRFVRALTPPPLEGGSLPAALRRLCATTGDTAPALAVHFQISGSPAELPTAYEVTLLRIAQSALANAARHAQARHAEVTLSYMDTEVALDIVDDGVGFDPAPATGGYGLDGMRARAAAAGGALTVESAPGQGTAVAVTLPLPAPDRTGGAR